MRHLEAVSSTASGALPSPSSSTKRHREEEPTHAPRTNDDSERAERKARKKEEKRKLRQKEHGESDEPALRESTELSPAVSNEAASLIDDERAAKKQRKAEKKARKLDESTYNEPTLKTPKSEDYSRPVEKAAGAPRKMLKSYDKNADMESIVEATAGMDEEQMLRFFSQPAPSLPTPRPTPSSRPVASEPKLPVTTSRKGETLFDGLCFADFLASSSLTSKQLTELAGAHGLTITHGPFTVSEDRILERVLQESAESQGIEWSEMVDIVRAPSDDDVKKALWFKLTRALNFRRLAAVRQHLKSKYSPVLGKGRFTSEEVATLTGAVKTHGQAWTTVGEIVGRPPKACETKWRRIAQKDTDQKGGAGRWKAEETDLLKTAVAKFGEGSWAAVGDMVPARTAEDCSDRWRHLSGKKAKFPTLHRSILVQGISLQDKKNVDRIKWSKLQVGALADYAERRLLHAWLIMSKDAVAAGVSPDDFPAQVAWAVAQHSAASNDNSSDDEVSEEE